MKTFTASREILATPDQVFSAIADPKRLTKWWGPKGFTNTTTRCEFKEGGLWSLTMHGPDGSSYPNENMFIVIEPSKKVVIQHVSDPKFRLTISLSRSTQGTHVSWTQEFESLEVAKRIEHIVIPANEQNLERLSVEVLNNSR